MSYNMTINEIIEFLQTITDPVQGSNLMYQFENSLNHSKEITIRHSFNNKLQAYYYFKILSKVPNIECSLSELKSTTCVPSYQVDDEKLKEAIDYHEEWKYNFVFRFCINDIRKTYDNCNM